MRESISSCYPYVSEVIAAFDENGRAWSGHDISGRIESCVSELRQIDTERKVRFVSSDFVAKTDDLMKADTALRQCDIDSVEKSSPLILQLDCDEIIPDWTHFKSCLSHFSMSDYSGMEYGAVWLSTHMSGNMYLERCNRDFSYWDAISGPVAIKPGQTLTLEPQIVGDSVRFVPNQSAIPMSIRHYVLHPAMLRPDLSIREKMEFLSGHSKQIRGNQIYTDWNFAKRHPYLFCLISKLLRKNEIHRPVNLSYVTSHLQDGLWKYYFPQ